MMTQLPEADQPPRRGALALLHASARLLRPHSREVACMLGFTLICEAAASLGPWALSRVVDLHLPNRDLAGALPALGLAAAGVVVWKLSHLQVSRINARLTATTGEDLDMKVWAAYSRLPATEVARTPHGVALTRMVDADRVATAVMDTLPTLLTVTALTIMMTTAMLLIDWRIGLSTVVMVLLVTLTFYRRALRRQSEAGARRQKARDTTLAFTDRWLSPDGIRNGRAVAADRNLERAFQRLTRAFRAHDVEIVNKRDHTYGVGTLANASLAITTTLLVFLLSASVGALIGIIFLQRWLLDGIKNALHHLGRAAEMLDALDALQALDTLPRERTSGDKTPRARHDLEFKNVTVARRVEGLDLTVPAGKRIAICGPSGSGKSTVGELAAGLIYPDEGEVMIGGKDIRTLHQRSVRDVVQLLLPQPYVVDGTLEENVRVERDIGLHTILTAIECADVDAVMDALMPFDEPALQVRLGGQRLSSGQAQRIALARTLAGLYPSVGARPTMRDRRRSYAFNQLVEVPSVPLTGARILILDEPTSALDEDTARRVLDNIEWITRAHGVSLLLFTHDEPPDWIDEVVWLTRRDDDPFDEAEDPFDTSSVPDPSDLLHAAKWSTWQSLTTASWSSIEEIERRTQRDRQSIQAALHALREDGTVEQRGGLVCPRRLVSLYRRKSGTRFA